MKTKSWITIALLAGGVVVAGCAAPHRTHRDATQPYNPDAPAFPPEGPYVAVARPDQPPGPGKPIVLLNSGLMKTLAVDRPPIVQRNPNGLLQIQVGLRNRRDDKRMMLQIQTLFFNDSGKVLYSQTGSEAAWQTLSVAPNQTEFYNQQALTPEAVSYIIQIRQLWPNR